MCDILSSSSRTTFGRINRRTNAAAPAHLKRKKVRRLTFDNYQLKKIYLNFLNFAINISAVRYTVIIDERLEKNSLTRQKLRFS